MGTVITLMSCANLSRTVAVLGDEPGHSTSMVPGSAVGYMPQEIALYQGLFAFFVFLCLYMYRDDH